MTATTGLVPGDRIGNYRIESELSCDGIGVTYAAVHQVLPRRAVIKVLHATSQSRVVHLLREACMLDALHHPGIIRVYESGLLNDRRPWFASELVEGPALTSVMTPGTSASPTSGGARSSAERCGGPIERVDALALVRDLAGILEHAHNRGVIHCGLRPSRVLLTTRSRGYPVCIADWSDARTHDATPQAYVVTAASWSYTAPELAAGDAVDDRADVFALGVITYQLITGTTPFEGRIAAAPDGSTEHVPTERHCPDLPRELTTLVDQMLAYARWDRPSSAEVYTDLCWMVDAIAQAMPRANVPRIRRPRWTPAIEFASEPPTQPQLALDPDRTDD